MSIVEDWDLEEQNEDYNLASVIKREKLRGYSDDWDDDDEGWAYD